MRCNMKNSDRKEVWLAVVNVFAASRKAGSVWKKAAVMLNEAGVPYKAMFTGNGDNAIAISRKASARGYRKFIAVGGDGTVHDVLNGIMNFVEASEDASLSDFSLGVIPVGSGNDWARCTMKNRTIENAVSLIASSSLAAQDVVKVELLDGENLEDAMPVSSAYMVNIGGIGLDAKVCEIVNRKKEQGKRGKILYVTALLKCIRERVPCTASVCCDGVLAFEGKYLSIGLGIGKYSGGGMRQTPDAELDDGFLDLTVIPDIPLSTIAKAAPKLFTDKLRTVKELTFVRGKSISVVCREPVEVDGEVVGIAPVRFNVLPQQLNIIKEQAL